MGYEIASAIATDGPALDRLFVQVGGGALASSCIQAFVEARALGVLPSEPRVHTVQTRSASPLKRAFDLLKKHRPGAGSEPAETGRDGAWHEQRLRHAATHRSEFMWPWEGVTKSVASGILDDETYDWLAVVRGMLATGGDTHVVDEETLLEANVMALDATGIAVDATGSAGLAGLIQALRSGSVGASDAVGVLFTGERR